MKTKKMKKVNQLFFLLFSYILFAKWAVGYKAFTDFSLIVIFATSLVMFADTYFEKQSLKGILLKGVVFLLIFLSYSPIFIFEDNIIHLLTKEDAFYEYFGAIFFFITSIVFFAKFIRDESGNNFIIFKMKRNIFYLTFALAFFFAFGEEISWGQRIFGISTPEAIKSINFQDEFNIHNLIIPLTNDHDGQVVHKLNIKHLCHKLFNIFWFTLCILIPVLNKLSLTINRLLKSIKVPISPIWIGSFFIINHYFPRLLYGFTDTRIHHGIREIAEFNYALLFLVLCLIIGGESKKRSYSSSHFGLRSWVSERNIAINH